MDTRVTEIADGIHQLSTFVPESGLRFNQYLIVDDEPLLFHTGPRRLFPQVRDAIDSIMPTENLRWITFGHLESDESGAMNQFLAAAPDAQVAHGFLGTVVSLEDLADRPPRALADGEVLELGRHRVRHIDTPHVPHGWDARVLFEETTRTLLCGDLCTQLGDLPAVTSDDIVAAAIEAEDAFGQSCLTPSTGATVRRLAALEPALLAVMHGSCFAGDGAAVLERIADDFDSRLATALTS